MSSKGSSAASSGSPQMTLFSYVHLRAPLPGDINPEIFGNGTKPEAYFLMRRSKDGYVSSTGMFKASFPWATKAEEDLERKYVKSHYDASSEETAGNLWVHPDDALSLSTDYHCRVWIEALVDDRKVGADSRNKAVTPPPSYKPTTEATAESLDPGSIKSKSSRSVSPARKIAQPRKSRIAKAVAKDQTSNGVQQKETTPASTTEASTEKEVPAVPLSTTTTTTTVTKTEEVTENGAEDAADSVSNTAVKSEITDGETTTKVEVETTTETKGDVVIESTHVKVELPSASDAPESPEEMIAKAKEMVAEAMKDASDTTSNNKKRKIDESEDMPDIKTLEIDSPKKSKRVRVIDVITEEKFQKRALIGLGATVAIG
ncbi:hypothetical protein ABW19_dt0202484 [Dactylella cylindrospora]|nr:hypothetical protein ABW19_dt0202484 [Dactylella cylindrospora]